MTVATVRLLIADPEVHDTAEAAGDGARKVFRLPQAPVVADSQVVVVNGATKVEGPDYSILDEAGVVTFVAAPPAAVDPAVPNVRIDYRHTLLSDASLAQLLTLENGSDKLAAASALDVIASSEALIQKKIELLDLKTDGPAVAKALRDHAAALRKQVEEGLGEDPAGAFDIAELVADDFAARERLDAQVVRSW